MMKQNKPSYTKSARLKFTLVIIYSGKTNSWPFNGPSKAQFSHCSYFHGKLVIRHKMETNLSSVLVQSVWTISSVSLYHLK